MHNRPFISVESHFDRMRGCGFEGIVGDWKMWPFFPYHSDKVVKDLGFSCLLGMEDTIMSYSLALLTRYHSMTSAEVETLCDEVMKELMREKKYGDKAWYIYGKKPDNNMEREFSEVPPAPPST